MKRGTEKATVGRSLSAEERKEARDRKRERQRLENILRAAAMHEQRLESGQQGALALKVAPARIQVGCSGWFYWHWKGAFYPEHLNTSQWFRHYGSQFSTVELNAPFYSWPTLRTVQGWLRQAPSRSFQYTIKVCELITHVNRFVGTQRLIQDFCFIGDVLGDACGCFLYQLPPSYHYTSRRLDSILRQLPAERRNVVEFRHRSWWNDKVFKAFEKVGCTFCSCSGPRLPDELVKTGPEIYVRFHGPVRWYRHDYTTEELLVWVERIRKSRCKTVWAYFNNDRDARAISNAREFRQLLQGALKER